MDGIVVYDLQIYGHIEEWVSLAPYYVVELYESVPTRHQVLDLEGTRVVSRRRWIQAGIRLVLHRGDLRLMMRRAFFCSLRRLVISVFGASPQMMMA